LFIISAIIIVFAVLAAEQNALLHIKKLVMENRIGFRLDFIVKPAIVSGIQKRKLILNMSNIKTLDWFK